MINLSPILIHANSRGNYPTVSVMREIQKANNMLKLGIIFPDKSLSEACLADLRLDTGERCDYSYSEGTIWNNELCTWTERKLYLSFV